MESRSRLAPREAAGEYQGVFATGEAAALLAAPALMTSLVADWGQLGWFVLAGVFLIPAVAAVPVTRRALITRPAPYSPRSGPRLRPDAGSAARS